MHWFGSGGIQDGTDEKLLRIDRQPEAFTSLWEKKRGGFGGETVLL